MLLSETILMEILFSLQNRRFYLTLESAVLSHFRIGGFVPFPKSAVSSHLKLVVLSCPQVFWVLLLLRRF